MTQAAAALAAAASMPPDILSQHSLQTSLQAVNAALGGSGSGSAADRDQSTTEEATCSGQLETDAGPQSAADLRYRAGLQAQLTASRAALYAALRGSS